MERKDRSYYLINSKKQIELPTIHRVFHKKSQKTVIFTGRGGKIKEIFKKAIQNIKKSKWTFFGHLQQFIKKPSATRLRAFHLRLKCINQMIRHSNALLSFRKNDFEVGVH